MGGSLYFLGLLLATGDFRAASGSSFSSDETVWRRLEMTGDDVAELAWDELVVAVAGRSIRLLMSMLL
jgi:hypothetical protein